MKTGTTFKTFFNNTLFTGKKTTEFLASLLSVMQELVKKGKNQVRKFMSREATKIFKLICFKNNNKKNTLTANI